MPIGKQYEERSTEISIKRAEMRKIVLFMEKIAQARFPIGITRMNIRKRGTTGDSWDVSMTVSAYHRKEEAKKPPAKDEADEGSGEE